MALKMRNGEESEARARDYMYICMETSEEMVSKQDHGSAECGTITSTVCHVGLGLTQEGSGDSSS